MKKKHYIVTLIASASVDVNVEAESRDEAIELAYQNSSSPSLCRHCSSKLDVGSFFDEIVTEADGNDVEE